MSEFALKFGPHRLAGYRIGAGAPLLIVHGGPGVPCAYVYRAHTAYASEGFEVVSWDQLGCGRSDRPGDKALWTVAGYVEEVEEVRRQLGWERFLLLGNSGVACSASNIACAISSMCRHW
jgi:proline iminopeptidase